MLSECLNNGQGAIRRVIAMALLRNIFNKTPLWRRNNRPYVEPTEEQKRLKAIQREKSRKDLAMMFGTIEALCPGVINNTMKQMKVAGMFK